VDALRRWPVCIVAAAAVSSALSAQTASDLFQRAVMAERTAGRLDSAIVLYQRVARQAGTDRPLAARALLSLGRAYETLGRGEARAAYERVLREYGDQRELAAQARVRIAALDPSSARGRALGANTEAMIRRVSRELHDFTTGTVSPNGRYFSYTDAPTGNLAVHDLSTGVNRLLTTNDPTKGSSSYAESSMISPSGLDIAYMWYTGASGVRRYELRVVPVRGGTSRSVALRDVAYLELCGWFPDAKRILAVVKGDPALRDRGDTTRGALAVVDVESATVRRLRDFSYTAALGATVSPDGKWIAFAVPANDELGRNPSIRVMAADGSHEHALIDHPSANWQPIWTPDGRGIVFKSDRTGSEGLWFQEVVDGAARTEPVVLMADARGDGLLGFARDGRLFYTPTALRDISVAALDAQTGEVVDEPRIVTKRYVGSNINPDLSPDGRRLTFLSMRGPGSGMAPGTRVLVIVDLVSGEQREFSPRLLVFQHPRWSRDGRSILMWGRGTDGVNGFFRLDAVTGALDALTTSPRVAPTPEEWSADGRSIFYQRWDSTAAGSSLWRYDLDDSTHRAVYTPDSLLSVTAIAPSVDGRWLGFNATYRSGAGTSVQRSVALSLATQVLQPLESGAGYALLTPLTGGDLLGFRRRASDSVTELWRVSVAGGASRKLAFESRARMVSLPRAAANGSRIAFSIASDDPNAGGIWTMENFLPQPRRPR
jgi:Tol biopolymer transport system component